MWALGFKGLKSCSSLSQIWNKEQRNHKTEFHYVEYRIDCEIIVVQPLYLWLLSHKLDCCLASVRCSAAVASLIVSPVLAVGEIKYPPPPPTLTLISPSLRILTSADTRLVDVGVQWSPKTPQSSETRFRVSRSSRNIQFLWTCIFLIQ
jgi:hypothetical protein